MPDRERALLVGVDGQAKPGFAPAESLAELEELARSAGALVEGRFLQTRARRDPTYLIGLGKLREIRDWVLARRVDLVIFDEELRPAQKRNLESFLEVKILDRTEIILDIFAQRARTREGKLQVESAQLQYRLPRLAGKGVALSRLGGGIGTRGPGETRLETDRRTIRLRLRRIQHQLQKLESRRALQRRKRQGVPIPTVSLVGYTNAGKSTLFSRLTGENTYVSHRLFATLDPLVRKVVLAAGQEFLLSDTVGFVRKLPHTLVAAFHATLEETLQSDLVLHVIDVSVPQWELLRAAVYQVLEEIGLSQRPVLEVYNKIDLLKSTPLPFSRREHVLVSARTGEGCQQLLGRIQDSISRDYSRVDLVIPFRRGDVLSKLRERGCVEREQYRSDGVWLRALVPYADLQRYQEFVDTSHVSDRHNRPAQRR